MAPTAALTGSALVVGTWHMLLGDLAAVGVLQVFRHALRADGLLVHKELSMMPLLLPDHTSVSTSSLVWPGSSLQSVSIKQPTWNWCCVGESNCLIET